MLLAVQSGGLTERLGVEGALRAISEAGFDGVDMNLNNYVDGTKIRAHCIKEHGSFFDQDDEAICAEARRLKEMADRYGLKYLQAHAPFPNYVDHEPTDAYVLETVKKTIMMCGVMECRYLIVHPGYLPFEKRMPKDAEWDYNIRMYTALIPSLRKYGVVCCLENMIAWNRGVGKDCICADPEEAVRYVDALNEIAGEELFAFCLDVGHTNVVSRDLYQVIVRLGSRIKALHIHDNSGHNDQHKFPYMGTLPWNDFCRGLHDIGFKEHLSFETFRTAKDFPVELTPQLLKLLHATGELFAGRIEGNHQ